MKKNFWKKNLLLIGLTLVVAGGVITFAYASTPQEDIAKYTEYIKTNAAHPDMIKMDYAERAIAYAKVGQWENCLKDNAWLKTNRIYTWSSYKGLSEARTKAFLALGRTDEAVQDMYETFLAGAHPSDLRRLKTFIAQNPQYSNYLDLNARASMIQKYATLEYAKEMYTSADYTSAIRSTENGQYMFRVAEVMLNFLAEEDRMWDAWGRTISTRYNVCKFHSEDPTYGHSGETREAFIANGSIDCGYVLSCAGLQEAIRVEQKWGDFCMKSFGYMQRGTKNSIAMYQKELVNAGCSASGSSAQYSTPANNSAITPSTNAYGYLPINTTSPSNTTTQPVSNTWSAVQPTAPEEENSGVLNKVDNTVNSVNNTVTGIDNAVKNVDSVLKGIKGLRF